MFLASCLTYHNWRFSSAIDIPTYYAHRLHQLLLLCFTSSTINEELRTVFEIGYPCREIIILPYDMRSLQRYYSASKKKLSFKDKLVETALNIVVNS